jgi:hypothetical protein
MAPAHGAGKSGQIGGHVLLITDMTPDLVELGDRGAVVHRQGDAVVTHERHHPKRLEDHRLAAGVRPGDDEGAHSLGQAKIERHHAMRRVALLAAAEHVCPQCQQPFVEKRVTRGAEYQFGTLAWDHNAAAAESTEPGPSLDRVDFGKRVDGRCELVADGEEPRGDLGDDAFDLVPLAGDRVGEVVVELDHFERLDECRGATP